MSVYSLISVLCDVIDNYRMILNRVRNVIQDSYLTGYRDGVERTLKDLVKNNVLKDYEIQTVEDDTTGSGYIEFFAIANKVGRYDRN